MSTVTDAPTDSTSSGPLVVGVGSLYAIDADGAPGGLVVEALAPALALGGRAVAASRVGLDRFGTAVVAALRRRGIDPTSVQTDPDHVTPRLIVRAGAARMEPFAAFDSIQWDSDLEALGRGADVVATDACSRRHGQSRSTIDRLLMAASTAIRVVDLATRAPTPDAARLEREHVGNALDLCDLVVVDATALRSLVPAASDLLEAARAAVRLAQRATFIALGEDRSSIVVADRTGTEAITPHESLAAAGPTELALRGAFALVEGRPVRALLAERGRG
jgi:sugar/nucleoside kinase (ribokinase family)